MGPIHDWPWHRCDPARDSKRRCAVFRVGICRQLWSRGAACDWWRKWVYWHVGIPRVSGQCRYLDGAARPWALSLDTCDPRNTLHDHSKREHYRRAVKLITRPARNALGIGVLIGRGQMHIERGRCHAPSRVVCAVVRQRFFGIPATDTDIISAQHFRRQSRDGYGGAVRGQR